MSWFGGDDPVPTPPDAKSARRGAVAADPKTLGLTPAPLPSATATLATDTSAADRAAERQRKRAAAGSTLVTPGLATPGPAPRFHKMTLIGG